MEIRKNLILFTGDSSAVLRKNLSSWMGSFAEKYGDSNVATVRIGETDPASVVSELLSMPFFAEKRLVVFEGIPRLRSLGSSKSEESGNDSEESFENPSDPAAAVEAAVLSVFDKIPDSTFAIFVSENPNRTSALFKKLVAEGEMKVFAGLNVAGAENYVVERLPGITPKALSALLERTAKNPDRRKNEEMEIDDRRLRGAVEKLSLGFGETKIDEKEIDEAEPQESKTKAYFLGDHILSGNLATTVSVLRSILEKDSPYSVFPSIVSTVRRSVHVELLRRNGKSDSEICAATGYSAYPVKLAKRMSDSEYRSAQATYAALVKFETDWRTGNAPGEDEAAQLETGIVSAILAARKAG